MHGLKSHNVIKLNPLKINTILTKVLHKIDFINQLQAWYHSKIKLNSSKASSNLINHPQHKIKLGMLLLSI